MSGSEDDFHFESADEDDTMSIVKGKEKKPKSESRDQAQAEVKGHKETSSVSDDAKVKDSATDLESKMEIVDINAENGAKSPAEIRESLAMEEKGREHTPTRKVERQMKPEEKDEVVPEKDKQRQALQNLEEAAAAQVLSSIYLPYVLAWCQL